MNLDSFFLFLGFVVSLEAGRGDVGERVLGLLTVGEGDGGVTVVVESRVVGSLLVQVAGTRLFWASYLGRLGKPVEGTLVSGTPVVTPVALVDGTQAVAGSSVGGRTDDDECSTFTRDVNMCALLLLSRPTYISLTPTVSRNFPTSTSEATGWALWLQKAA